jgi:hypothetical protein
MTASQPLSGWSMAEAELWRRICDHDFEAADHSPNFLQRLARDKAWSVPFARGAVAEYRRFAFLCMRSDAPLTPSEEVDEVWHQHLVWSRDYWDLWCRERLGAPLHHDPSRGGPQQHAYFQTRYAATLALYERWFGPPPEAYWPGTRRRFRTTARFRGIDTERAMIVPRFWRFTLKGRRR